MNQHAETSMMMTKQLISNKNDAESTPPVDTLIHLGAGLCSELDLYLELHPRKILLVEADPQLAAELKKQSDGLKQVQVWCKAVAGRSGSVTFHRYNLPDAGSLHPASGLLRLYPGLRLLENMEMNAVSPEALLQPFELQANQNNQLVIDLPGEELPVLQTLHQADQLYLFRRIRLHCGIVPLFEGSEPSDRILQWLKDIGYYIVAEEREADPDRPYWDLDRDDLQLQNREYLQQISRLQEKLEQSIQTRETGIALISELKSKVEDLTREREELIQSSGELQKRAEALIKERNEQAKKIETLIKERDEQAKKIETLIKERDEQAKKIEALDEERGEQAKKIEALIKERDEQAKLAGERQSLLDRITSENAAHASEITGLLQNQQTRLDQVEKGLNDQLSKGLENSTRQIESYIGIQTYLTRGQIIPDMHGWPVSPDFALFLIHAIENNDYDLILEFGSGTSTMLMAKAILKRIQRQAIRQLQLKEYSGNEPLQIPYREEITDLIQWTPAILKQALSDYRGIPPKIVSFEHHLKFYEETSAKLQQAGVEGMVELVHAPLRDYLTWNGERFLYYACEEKIADIARELKGDRARIFVVVDGPPASTGKNARYPALPIVLQYLADHKLDVLLDDYVRQDEKEIVEKWLEILKDRSLDYEKSIFKMEKDACLITLK